MNVLLICGNPNRITYQTSYDILMPENLHMHPKLQVEWVETIIKGKEQLEDELTIVTNSDHIINRFRVAKKNKEITNLDIIFYPFNNEKEIHIESDFKGELSEYPKHFLDEWNNQLLKLL